MIDAFSYANEYCEVGLWVKASNLETLDQNMGNITDVDKYTR
jgi:hypothetical protein